VDPAPGSGAADGGARGAAARRVVTIGLVTGLFVVTAGTAPLWIPLAWAFDHLHRGRRSALACGAFLLWYLGCELLGVAGSAWAWLRWRGDPERFARRNFELQCRWAEALWRGAARAFGMGMELEEDDALAAGPYLILCRHATIVDVLVPCLAASVRHGVRLRYVLKRELLWDPCVDIVGNRLPNAFVDRSGADSERELRRLRALGQGLTAGEGLMIFPEGTRFTVAKRGRLIEKAREAADPDRQAQVEALRHVLPPRLGGSLALLDAAPGTDVIFCAHTGIDHLTSFWDLWRGGLRGAVLRAHFWRVPADRIPAGPEARARWLMEQWQRVDGWIAERRNAADTPPSARRAGAGRGEMASSDC